MDDKHRNDPNHTDWQEEQQEWERAMRDSLRNDKQQQHQQPEEIETPLLVPVTLKNEKPTVSAPIIGEASIRTTSEPTLTTATETAVTTTTRKTTRTKSDVLGSMQDDIDKCPAIPPISNLSKAQTKNAVLDERIKVPSALTEKLDRSKVEDKPSPVLCPELHHNKSHIRKDRKQDDQLDRAALEKCPYVETCDNEASPCVNTLDTLNWEEIHANDLSMVVERVPPLCTTPFHSTTGSESTLLESDQSSELIVQPSHEEQQEMGGETTAESGTPDLSIIGEDVDFNDIVVGTGEMHSDNLEAPILPVVQNFNHSISTGVHLIQAVLVDVEEEQRQDALLDQLTNQLLSAPQVEVVETFDQACETPLTNGSDGEGGSIGRTKNIFRTVIRFSCLIIFLAISITVIMLSVRR